MVLSQRLKAGTYSNTSSLELPDLYLPPGTQVVGNKAYDYYLSEDPLAGINVYQTPTRKKNSKHLAASR